MIKSTEGLTRQLFKLFSELENMNIGTKLDRANNFLKINKKNKKDPNRISITKFISNEKAIYNSTLDRYNNIVNITGGKTKLLK